MQLRATNDGSGKTTILLDGNAGNGAFGGNGQGGRVSVFPKDADETKAATATIDFRADGQGRIGGGFYQATGQILGPPVMGVDGTLKVQNASGNDTAVITGHDGAVLLGGASAADAPIHLRTADGLLRVGGGKVPAPQYGVGLKPQGTNGVLSLQDKDGNEILRLAAGAGSIVAGGFGQDGHLALFPKTDAQGKPVTHTSDPNAATVHVSAQSGNIRLGGNGQDGDVQMFPKAATAATISSGKGATIHLDGDKGNISITGDLLLTHADCAEDFAIVDTAVEPGTVMVIGNGGALRTSTQAYDKRVAGVVSGGGEYKPGIVLDRRGSQENRYPIALVGKVYCKVDASYGAVDIGDLLTTSATPGHAMKAGDSRRAFGSVIGKALQPIDRGQGLIPILVALQ
jgi:hypothetical protein